MFEPIKFAESSSIIVKPDGVTLPKTPARFFMLSNWNVENNENFPIKTAGDSMEEAELEVFWGFGGVYAHQLFPGQTTVLIPCANLQDVCLRCRNDQTVNVWFSYFQ